MRNRARGSFNHPNSFLRFGNQAAFVQVRRLLGDVATREGVFHLLHCEETQCEVVLERLRSLLLAHKDSILAPLMSLEEWVRKSQD
jgi:hypothetical protein